MTEQQIQEHEARAERPRLCVECRHYRDDGHYPRRHECGHPSRMSFVTGEVAPEMCEIMRGSFGTCGPEGRLWEARDER